jgi:hypothetical protein
MAGAQPGAPVTAAKTAKAKLIAVDGVDAPAVLAAARAALVASTSGAPAGARGGISRWDASGIFQDLEVAEEEAGAPSARTVLLLYAADLAFRLRWQVRPALAEGRTVVVAPYVATAIAFGRAAGLSATWLENLFRFAPRASERHVIAARNAAPAKDGFVGFACGREAGNSVPARQRLIKQTAAHLSRSAKRRPSTRRRQTRTAR